MISPGLSVIDIGNPNTDNRQTLDEKDEQNVCEKYKDSVDQGWAWVVLLGGFFVSFSIVGSQKSFGMLYADLSTEYRTSNKALSITQSLAGFLQQFLGPISAILIKKYSHRTLIISGGICIGGGLMVSSLAPSIGVLYMTYGIISGIGYGLCFSPSVVIIANYFNKYRAFASGISLAGGGLGGMVFPYLIQYLLKKHGLGDALRVYGAIMLSICPCGLLMRPLQDSTRQTDNQPGSSLTISKLETHTIFKDSLIFIQQIMRAVYDLEWSLFRQWKCACFFGVVFFAMFGYNSLFNVLPPFLDELGFKTEDSAFVLLIFGLFDLLGRILFGFLMNVFTKHRHGLFTLAIFVFGSGIIGTYFIHTKVGFCVLLGCYGLFAGGYNGTLMVMAVEYVDLDRLPSTWGFMCWSAAIAFLLNPFATGALRDSTGTWAHTFLLSGTMSLTAVLILIFKHVRDRTKTSSDIKSISVSVERY